MASLSLAHLGEYLFVVSFYGEKRSWDSYLINQSMGYMLAHTLAVVEFVVGWYFIPAKTDSLFSTICMLLGISMISIGHYLRIGAMFTACRNFNHEVQF
jgi:hypothetical protein